MNGNKKYIEIIKDARIEKLQRYIVINIKSGDILGIIVYYTSWRKYCFCPYKDTIWAADCLKQIMYFIDDKNRELANVWKERKEFMQRCL